MLLPAPPPNSFSSRLHDRLDYKQACLRSRPMTPLLKFSPPPSPLTCMSLLIEMIDSQGYGDCDSTSPPPNLHLKSLRRSHAFSLFSDRLLIALRYSSGFETLLMELMTIS